jgi:hypothetical protein
VLIVPPPFVGRICSHQFDETPHRNVRPGRRLTFRGAVSSYCRQEHTIQQAREEADERRSGYRYVQLADALRDMITTGEIGPA